MVEEYSGYDRPREGWKATYFPHGIVLMPPGSEKDAPVNAIYTPEHLTEMWRRAKSRSKSLERMEENDE